jgi:hypothetical protein
MYAQYRVREIMARRYSCSGKSATTNMFNIKIYLIIKLMLFIWYHKY